MRTFAVAGLALTVPVVAAGAEESFILDPAHSQPMFEVQYMAGFSNQRGSFSKLDGKVTLDRTAKTGTVDVTIYTDSIHTISDRLDTQVKGEDFFNVARYPTMTFKSSNVAFEGDRVVGVDGELTMIGVAKPVSLNVSNFVCGQQPFNMKPVCGAEATATIRRSEWGMRSGILEAVSDQVTITIPIEAYRE
jgi:polyisoprenoid-binding protein YceI